MSRQSHQVAMITFTCDLPGCEVSFERRGMSWELPKGWAVFRNAFYHSLDHLAEALAYEIGREFDDVNAVIVEIHLDRTIANQGSQKFNERTQGRWTPIERPVISR